MKKIRKKLHLSEEGFSLIELIVTLLVSSVVTAAVAGFLSAGIRYYQNADEETTLQKESQIAELFLTELLQESIDYSVILSSEDPSGITYAIEVERDGVVSVVALKDNQLWYSDVDASKSVAEKLTDLIAKGKQGAFLADKVESFSVSPETRESAINDKNGLVLLNLSFKVRQKEYTETATVSLRNRKRN